MTRARNQADATRVAGAVMYRGMSGYLARIESPEEYAYVRWGLGVHEAWITGMDAAQEGHWKYPNGNYLFPFPLAIGEPDGGTRENCLILRSNGYIDVECARSDFSDFVVEFECLSPKILFQGACISTSHLLHVCNAASFHLIRSTTLRQPLRGR